VWSDRRWIAADRSAIDGDGFYFIYFSNSECGACRVFDDVWYPFVEMLAGKAAARFIIVLCGWFTRDCSSEDAKSLFKEFDVHVSPTVIVLKRSNGKVEKLLKYEGLTSALTLTFAYANVLAEKREAQPG
jgi:hypothetical protein